MAEEFLDGHGTRPAAVPRVDANVVDDSDADIVGDVAFYLCAGACLRADLECQMRFAESTIDNFSGR